ncbi:MAG TPA: methyltransferase domain-containing protein [Bryobacteraceae bacterium]|nr:methyltransferase domain-containing protein [Bryobacteraceae bacterium]
MNNAALVERLPRWLARHILHFEAAIQDAVARFAGGLPAGARVLDAGAGEARHARYFAEQHYCGVDLAVGDDSWDYSRLDAVADLTCLPFRSGCFDAAINIVTLEHVRAPGCVLREIARTLTGAAPLLVVVPHEWEVHQSPHDYFRYTRHGMTYLLEQAGMVEIRVEPVGGYFRLLARRLLNGLQFFTGGLRWLGFLPAALLLVPPALVIPFLDFLDRDRNFTLGYICTARKSS